MICHTAIILAFALCCVNAAFVVNVFEDDPVQESSADVLANCNYMSCNRRCRLLGFPGGSCSGSRCVCESRKQALDASVDQDLKDCYPLECDQSCRRIGFPGGACVNGRCKCDILKSEEDNEIPTADKEEMKQHELVLEQRNEVPDVRMKAALSSSCACDPRSCDMYCFRIHYTGGICVTGQCRCYR